MDGGGAREHEVGRFHVSVDDGDACAVQDVERREHLPDIL
jgi:hypothetical protein